MQLGQEALLLLGLTLLVVVIVALLAHREPLLLAMALRNLLRRRSSTAMVIAGLLIGTAIISGSLVMGDTLDHIFSSKVYDMTGETDEMVVGFDALGGFRSFNESYYHELVANETIQGLMETGELDGIAPILSHAVAVIALDQEGDWSQGEPEVQMIGIDPSAEATFGRGPLADLGLGPEGVALNHELAQELGVRPGDRILIFPGVPERRPEFNLSLTVKHIFPKAYGDADLLGQLNLFVELDLAQGLLGEQGRINGLRISNEGGVRNQARLTDRVHAAVNDTLNGLVGLEDLGFALSRDDTTLMLTDTLLSSELFENLEQRIEVRQIIPLLAVPVLLESAGHNGSEGASDNGSHGGIENGSVGGADGTGEGHNSSGDDLTPPPSLKTRPLLLGAELGPLLDPGVFYTTEQLAGELDLSNNVNVTCLLSGNNMSLLVEMVNLRDLGLDLPADDKFLGVVAADTARELLFGTPEVEASNGLLLFTTPGVNGSAILASELTLSELGLTTQKFKLELLQSAEQSADMITQIFLVLGLFSVVAGVMLIINLFVMLAGERRGELGIARALGMQRTHLLQMFLFEGVVYAVVAATLGSLAGLGLGYLIIYLFSFIFGDGEPLGELFTADTESLVLAFAAGMLVTTLTVLVASWKVSVLNIVAAIRDIPEEFRPTNRFQLLGLLGLLSGLIMSLAGLLHDNPFLLITGPCLVGLGLIPLLFKLGVTTERAMLVGGLITAVWALDPLRLGTEDDNLLRFFSDGLLLVTGGLLVLLSRTEGLLKLLDRLTARSSHTALFKTALAYPLHNRFRTGMTLAMFALIIFTVTTISLWQSIFGSSNQEYLEQQSGGYQIIAFTNPEAELDLQAELAASDEPGLQGLVDPDRGGVVGLYRLHQVEVEVETGSDPDRRVTNLYGVDREWLTYSDYPLALDPETGERLYALGFQYQDRQGDSYTIERPEDVWVAMARNDSLFVGDNSFQWVTRDRTGPPVRSELTLGAQVRVEVEGLARNGSLIAVMQEGWFLSGLFVNASFTQLLGADHPETFMLRLVDPSLANSEAFAKVLEREFIRYGTDTLVIEKQINEGLEQFLQIMTLVQGFLGLGLIVGIAGLGIIAVRAVHERFHEIGVMRAIGYTREAVMGSFVVEVSFMALLGIFLGVCLGLLSMYNLYQSIPAEEGFEFVVDGVKLTLIMALAYLASLLAAIGPSRAAARVAPAEALRYE